MSNHDLPSPPRFDWGQRVRTLEDLVNDGSFPGAASDELLVSRGTIGEIVQIGTHVDTNVTFYLVEFQNQNGQPGSRVIGCLDEELDHA